MVEGERVRADSPEDHGALPDAATQRRLSPAALRALDEARLRRVAEERPAAQDERGGRGGLEPVRYGDWEVKGLASDF